MKTSIPPQTILLPSPVLIVGTFGPDGVPNIMNAAWGGIVCSRPPCVSVSLREATRSYHNIQYSKAFTINFPSEKHVMEADYVGLVSGDDQDKFQKTGLTPVKSKLVNALYVKEFPCALECNLIREVRLGSHTMFVGEIMGVVADSEVLNENGFPDIEKVRPIVWGSFGSMAYYAIGDKLGDAFSVGSGISGSGG
jgi:flavin reductase (DIM6/NTAB) family NADH-FMN oxidoreductase RutF